MFRGKKITGFIIIGALLLCVGLASCIFYKGARYYYKQGMKYFEDQNYKKAETYLKKAVDKNKNRAQYTLGYAFALMKNDKEDQAIKQFNKVIKDKDNKIVLENNKLAYRGLGITYYEESDYENAYTNFSKALKIKEKENLDLDISYYLAKCEERLGRYEEAIQMYTTLLKEDNKDIENYCSRAYSYQKINENEKALKDYNSAIQLDKKDYDIYFLKYFLILDTDGSDKAKEVLNDALEIKTKDVDNYNIGKIYYYMDDTTKAESYLKKALKEEDYRGNFYLGEMAFKNKDYDNAIKYYKAYLGNNSEHESGTVYNQLGVSYLETENYEEALKAFQAGVILNESETIQALKFNEIVAYEKLIQFDKAYEKIKDYLKVYPDDEKAEKEFDFIQTRVQ